MRFLMRVIEQLFTLIRKRKEGQGDLTAGFLPEKSRVVAVVVSCTTWLRSILEQLVHLRPVNARGESLMEEINGKQVFYRLPIDLLLFFCQPCYYCSSSARTRDLPFYRFVARHVHLLGRNKDALYPFDVRCGPQKLAVLRFWVWPSPCKKKSSEVSKCLPCSTLVLIQARKFPVPACSPFRKKRNELSMSSTRKMTKM